MKYSRTVPEEVFDNAPLYERHFPLTKVTVIAAFVVFIFTVFGLTILGLASHYWLPDAERFLNEIMVKVVDWLRTF